MKFTQRYPELAPRAEHLGSFDHFAILGLLLASPRGTTGSRVQKLRHSRGIDGQQHTTGVAHWLVMICVYIPPKKAESEFAFNCSANEFTQRISIGIFHFWRSGKLEPHNLARLARPGGGIEHHEFCGTEQQSMYLQAKLVTYRGSWDSQMVTSPTSSYSINKVWY